jgi:hypothetical protein
MSDRRWRWWALASYVLLAVAVVGPGTLAERGRVAGMGIDLPGTIWIHWWVRTTLEHLSLPIWTDLLFYPDGKNFFDDTGANFVDAYLGVPFQWLFGVPDFLDPLDLLVLVGNALSMQALASDLSRGRFGAAWAAAAVFELNPYVVTQVSQGRPTQALLWFAVLATRHALRLHEGTWRDGVWFGVFTALQALTYWFMAYFITLALLPVVLLQIARSPRATVPRAGLAVGVALAIAAPFLFWITGEISAGNVHRLAYGNWGDGPAGTASRWSLVLLDVEQATWIVVILLAALAWRRTWPLLVGVALSWAFSVGAQLDVTTPPLQNHLFVFLWEHVPMLTRLGFPERATSMTFLLLSAGAAVGLAQIDAVWPPLLVAGALAEGLWRGSLPVEHTSYRISDAVAHIRDEGGAVINLPLGSSETGMVLQTAHGQPMFGGMGEREPDLRPAGYEARLRNTFVVALGGSLNDEQPPIGYTRADRETLSQAYRWVWFDLTYTAPGWGDLGYAPRSKLARLQKELGDPVAMDDTYALFDLHAPIPADAPGLRPDARLGSHELDSLGVGALGRYVATAADGSGKPQTLPTPGLLPGSPALGTAPKASPAPGAAPAGAAPKPQPAEPVEPPGPPAPAPVPAPVPVTPR